MSNITNSSPINFTGINEKNSSNYDKLLAELMQLSGMNNDPKPSLIDRIEFINKYIGTLLKVGGPLADLILRYRGLGPIAFGMRNEAGFNGAIQNLAEALEKNYSQLPLAPDQLKYRALDSSMYAPVEASSQDGIDENGDLDFSKCKGDVFQMIQLYFIHLNSTLTHLAQNLMGSMNQSQKFIGKGNSVVDKINALVAGIDGNTDPNEKTACITDQDVLDFLNQNGIKISGSVVVGNRKLSKSDLLTLVADVNQKVSDATGSSTIQNAKLQNISGIVQGGLTGLSSAIKASNDLLQAIVRNM